MTKAPASAGYSGKSLIAKLGWKEGDRNRAAAQLWGLDRQGGDHDEKGDTVVR